MGKFFFFRGPFPTRRERERKENLFFVSLILLLLLLAALKVIVLSFSLEGCSIDWTTSLFHWPAPRAATSPPKKMNRSPFYGLVGAVLWFKLHLSIWLVLLILLGLYAAMGGYQYLSVVARTVKRDAT